MCIIIKKKNKKRKRRKRCFYYQNYLSLTPRKVNAFLSPTTFCLTFCHLVQCWLAIVLSPPRVCSFTASPLRLSLSSASYSMCSFSFTSLETPTAPQSHHRPSLPCYNHLPLCGDCDGLSKDIRIHRSFFFCNNYGRFISFAY